MKPSARSFACWSAGWLLPLLLTACIHKANQRPAQALAPPADAAPKPATTPVDLPPSAATIPSQPLATVSVQPETKPAPPVKRKKPASTSTQQAAAAPPPPSATTQQAAIESPGVSAIGQLSSGDPADLRKQTTDSIDSIERGLNAIGHTLSSQQEKTAAQIREFLKQARQALVSGDLDGAHTLAAKAKVLLSELSQ